MIILIIILVVILFIVGFYDDIIEAKKAEQGVSYIISSARNWTS